ncbi:hypothetical protein [Bradyrhizobium sp. CW7]|uniref:hypothetical protein n=1 Tax=Bradyrhizobium sp. CW7 TaxID=2782688 RepID=UPI00320ACE2B
MLSTAKLNNHLLPINHLNSIRFGTKMLSYEPRRFADCALPALFKRIHKAGKTPIIVAHFDHIGEISCEAEDKVRALRAQDVQLLNHSVLLAKVKDDPEILAATFAKCPTMAAHGARHFKKLSSVVARLRGVETNLVLSSWL